MKIIVQAKMPKKLAEIYQEKDPMKLFLNRDAELRELAKFRKSLQNELDLLEQLENSKKVNN